MELILKSKDGRLVTTSLIVASVFGKEHNKVCRDIENLQCSAEFNAANFGVISFHDSMNREQRAYEMTKDGFSFLVMGYTGEKAAQFKEAFINAFNKNESLLQNDDYIIMRSQEILTKRLELAEQLLSQKSEQLRLSMETIRQQVPKVEYYDTVLQSDSTITTTVIAAELGVTAMYLNRMLAQQHVQFMCDGVWVLSAEHKNKGYMRYKTHHRLDANGVDRTTQHGYWTERGRAFVHEQFKIYKAAKEAARLAAMPNITL